MAFLGRRVFLDSAFLGLCLIGFLGYAFPSLAAFPDAETVEFVTRKYNVLLENTRSGCGYYANPNTLTVSSQNSSVRELSVLLKPGEISGSMCNGVFEFWVLTVNCQTSEISYSERMGSPANWTQNFYKNLEVSQKVCGL
ncbi:MAG: hypothetical protein VKK42_00630 [Lyngbya sp.]|nr:hypothetical protein [Lyngbya sp.]